MEQIQTFCQPCKDKRKHKLITNNVFQQVFKQLRDAVVRLQLHSPCSTR